MPQVTRIEQAADAILALINSRPRSASSPRRWARWPAKRRDFEWDTLVSQAHTQPRPRRACLIEFCEHSEHDTFAKRIADAAARLARGPEEFRPLVDVAFWVLYGGGLTGQGADLPLCNAAPAGKGLQRRSLSISEPHGTLPERIGLQPRPSLPAPCGGQRLVWPPMQPTRASACPSARRALRRLGRSGTEPVMARVPPAAMFLLSEAERLKRPAPLWARTGASAETLGDPSRLSLPARNLGHRTPSSASVASRRD
jgi:hypothetical protein